MNLDTRIRNFGLEVDAFADATEVPSTRRVHGRKRRQDASRALGGVAAIAAVAAGAVLLKGNGGGGPTVDVSDTTLAPEGLDMFVVPSESMEPTLQAGNAVPTRPVADGDVERGDIVVFGFPPGTDVDFEGDIVKRIVGLPGETIEARDGVMFVDGAALDEPYLPAGTFTSDIAPVVVPEGHVYVLGDNRPSSRDSRYFDAIPIADVTAIVVLDG